MLEYSKFLEYSKMVENSDYCIIDKVMVCENVKVCCGHVYNNNLQEQYMFRVEECKLHEFTEIVKPKVVNYVVNKNGLIKCPKLDVVEVARIPVMNFIGNLRNYRETSFFNLLAELIGTGCSIYTEECVIPLEDLNFSKMKLSVTIPYVNDKGEPRTKGLMWFTDVPHIEDFTIVSKENIDNILEEYISEESITVEHKEDFYNEEVFLYHVHGENISCNVVNQDKLSYLVNKQMLLTVIGEVDSYRKVLEGIEVASFVLKKIYNIEDETESWYSSGSTGAHTRHLQFKLGRKTFASRSVKDKLCTRLDIFREELKQDGEGSEGRESREEYLAKLDLLLDEVFVGRDKEFAVLGARDILADIRGKSYGEMCILATSKKREYKRNSLCLNIYEYFWRSLLTDYSYLLDDLFMLYKGYQNAEICGGAYDTEVLLGIN